MSSLTTRCVLRILAASITAAAAPLTNITRLPPAYSARAPFCCSCSIPCSKSAQARLLSYRRITDDTSILLSLHLYLLFTHPDSLVRPCELTDSPTPSTFYPRPLSRTRTLSKSKSHAANHRRHRQSDIANPARHPSQYRNNTPLASQ
jgi:hypothetical protein